MADNLPAVHQPASIVQAPADTDSWTTVAEQVFRLAKAITGTEFVPKSLRNSEAATAAAVFYGREVGLPPMTALTQTHVIEGRPSLSAEAQRALVFAAGHEIEIEQSDGGLCRLRGRRRGQEQWTRVEWTIDTARAAGLLSKKGSAWASYPRAMLLARATTELCRMIFPDVIRGFRGLEEALDMADGDAAVAGTPEPVSGGATVQRKPRARKKAAPALPPGETPTVERPAIDGPPLPGEDQPEVVSGEVAEHPDPVEPPLPELPAEQQGDEDLPAASQEGEAETRPAAPSDDTAEPVEPEAEVANFAGVSKAQLRMIHGHMNGFDLGGNDNRAVRLAVIGTIVGHPVESSNDLTRQEASTLIDTLARCRDRAALDALLDDK